MAMHQQRLRKGARMRDEHYLEVLVISEISGVTEATPAIMGQSSLWAADSFLLCRLEESCFLLFYRKRKSSLAPSPAQWARHRVSGREGKWVEGCMTFPWEHILHTDWEEHMNNETLPREQGKHPSLQAVMWSLFLLLYKGLSKILINPRSF